MPSRKVQRVGGRNRERLKFMVVINPAGGIDNTRQTYEQQVASMFEQANVKVETVMTTSIACNGDYESDTIEET